MTFWIKMTTFVENKSSQCTLIGSRYTKVNDRLDNAKIRVLEKLGAESCCELVTRWNKLVHANSFSLHWQLSDGILLSLLSTVAMVLITHDHN
jgi:hypothetical protein